MSDSTETQGPAPVVKGRPKAKGRPKTTMSESSGPSSGPRRGRPENLRPFKPGTSGNPGGRPKGAAGFAERIRQATKEGQDLMAWALAIARNPKAKDRMAAIKWLGDRGWGTAPQEITITGPEGGPVVYRVVW